MGRDTDFIGDLRKEIGSAQATRYKHTQQKFAFVIGMLGIGGALKEAKDFVYLLYLSPIVAYLFDMYVIEENFGIRRAGVFIQKCGDASKYERLWEAAVRKNRDIFAYLAGPLLSFSAFFISVLYLWTKENVEWRFWIWIALNVVILIFLLFRKKVIDLKLDKFGAYVEKSKDSIFAESQNENNDQGK